MDKLQEKRKKLELQIQIKNLELKLKESSEAASRSQPPLSDRRRLPLPDLSIQPPDLSRPPPTYNYSGFSGFSGGYSGFSGGYSDFSGGFNGAAQQLSRPPNHGKIFVARLPTHGVSDYDLLEHFTQFGPVVEVYRPVDRSKNDEQKNFAFITFEREEIAMELI